MLLQRISTSIRPLTTAHLAQTMSLLELTGIELCQKIEAGLASNPALELIEENRCPTCHRRLPGKVPCPVCSRPDQSTTDQPIVFVSPSEDFRPAGNHYNGEEPKTDEWLAEEEDLPTFVLKQIAPELEVIDRPIAAHILTSLDEDGLLRTPLVEIARFCRVPLSRAQQVLRQIQRAEPVGVGSPTPQEALLVQLEVLAETRPVPALAARMVREGMDLLSRRAYTELGRTLGISASQAISVGRFIADNLNPYPGRSHWGEARQEVRSNPVYTNPEVIINCLNENPDSPLVVEILSPYAGMLRVNPLFRQALAEAPAEKAEQWQADLEQAGLLVKCLQQRNHTLVRLMERMVVLQREYVLHGDAYLEPVTRAQLAVELNVHESTVSRAVSDKAVQLPNGRIVPLAKWFDRSLHIRTALRQIIAEETEPFSDTQIADLLSKQGYPVARRTVAKYRAMEGILPARFRQARATPLTP
jgi:RNA polymerase sigma-54 factor